MDELTRAVDRLSGGPRNRANSALQLHRLEGHVGSGEHIEVAMELETWPGEEDRQFVWLLALLSVAPDSATEP